MQRPIEIQVTIESAPARRHSVSEPTVGKRSVMMSPV